MSTGTICCVRRAPSQDLCRASSALRISEGCSSSRIARARIAGSARSYQRKATKVHLAIIRGGVAPGCAGEGYCTGAARQTGTTCTQGADRTGAAAEPWSRRRRATHRQCQSQCIASPPGRLRLPRSSSRPTVAPRRRQRPARAARPRHVSSSSLARAGPSSLLLIVRPLHAPLGSRITTRRSRQRRRRSA